MTLPDETDAFYKGLHREEFRAVLKGSGPELSEYVEASVTRLHRLFATLLSMKNQLEGPTLDVASGRGILYRPIKHYLPNMLPYSLTEMKEGTLDIDGDTISCHAFHCDKERIPLEDQSIGTILFCDVIEHLIFYPMWTILEFNRVLKPGGRLVITTPNAAGVIRAMYILAGVNPGRTIEYKPNALYERHNREWTVMELQHVLRCAGFHDIVFTTHAHLIEPAEILFNTPMKASMDLRYLSPGKKSFIGLLMMISQAKFVGHQISTALKKSLEKDQKPFLFIPGGIRNRSYLVQVVVLAKRVLAEKIGKCSLKPSASFP